MAFNYFFATLALPPTYSSQTTLVSSTTRPNGRYNSLRHVVPLPVSRFSSGSIYIPINTTERMPSGIHDLPHLDIFISLEALSLLTLSPHQSKTISLSIVMTKHMGRG
ncbi:hypothetical protein VCHA34P112_80051 [Vibrio chagasii]|nr:hypothetical protein VCHA34P112_80051 [Vibrio chagasii]CAH7423474.1 hypothetical protein VCHA56P515_80148 [Vibrio chagasii]CAH7455213.1 hypothetical protein VCHA53O463_90135 [Vibrio chagasii]